MTVQPFSDNIRRRKTIIKSFLIRILRRKLAKTLQLKIKKNKNKRCRKTATLRFKILRKPRRYIMDEKEIIIKGKPNLDKLDKTEAKHFYSTLLSVILEYYEKTVTDKTK